LHSYIPQNLINCSPSTSTTCRLGSPKLRIANPCSVLAV